MSVVHLRPTGHDERRCVARQALGLYHHLVEGGVFEVCRPVDLKSSLVKALKHCLACHPILSAVVLGAETDAPAFGRPLRLNLDNHLVVVSPLLAAGPGDGHVDRSNWCQAATPLLLRALNDRPVNLDTVPAWKVWAAPLLTATATATASDQCPQRYVLFFAWAHSHGNGRSGLVFLKTLLRGLNMAMGHHHQPDSPAIKSTPPPCPYDDATDYATEDGLALDPPVDKAAKLTVSLPFFLSAALGSKLPGWLAARLGLHVAAAQRAEGMWRGAPVVEPQPDRPIARVEAFSIPGADVRAALAQCRRRDARLTGLMYQLLTRALSDLLPPEQAAVFVTSTPLDLRPAVMAAAAAGGLVRRDSMGNMTSMFQEVLPRSESASWDGWTDDDDGGSGGGGGLADSPPHHPTWQAAAKTTEGLRMQAGTLHNQPATMLRYVGDMGAWYRAKLREPRGESFEISNLGVFDPRMEEAPADGGPAEELQDAWRISDVIFAQPACAVGPVFYCSVVSLKDADMSVVLSWHGGALGVPDEAAFMREVAAKFRAWMSKLAGANDAAAKSTGSKVTVAQVS